MNFTQPELLLRHHRAEVHILFFQNAPAAGAERAGLLQRLDDLAVEVLDAVDKLFQVVSA